MNLKPRDYKSAPRDHEVPRCLQLVYRGARYSADNEITPVISAIGLGAECGACMGRNATWNVANFHMGLIMYYNESVM